MPDRGVVAVVETQLSTSGLKHLPVFGELGHRVAFVSNTPGRYDGLANWHGTVGTGGVELLTGDTNSVAGILAALEPLHGDLRCVYTHCDYNLPLVAAVARELGLPGLDPAAARTARNKLTTRLRCAAAGVPCPRFAHVTGVDAAVAAARSFGLPCVVKPMTESASNGVRLCQTLDEVAGHAGTIMGQPLDARGQARQPGALVEEYVLGHEVSVESVTVDGQIRVLGVTDKVLAPHPWFVETGDTFPSLLPERATKELADTAVAALAAIGHDFGAAHSELKLTAGGPVLIEVNARIGGGQIAELVEAALGFDYRREVLRMHLGERPDLSPIRHGGSADRHLTARADGTVAAVLGVDLARRVPGVLDVEVAVGPGDTVRAATSDHHLCGHVLAAADSPGEATRRAETAAGQISFVLA